MIVGAAGPAINMVYSFVARDAGFLQKYGLDVRIVVFDAGSIFGPGRARAKLNSLCRRDQPPLLRALKGQTQLLLPPASIRSLIA